jgi:hypothetical protein
MSVYMSCVYLCVCLWVCASPHLLLLTSYTKHTPHAINNLTTTTTTPLHTNNNPTPPTDHVAKAPRPRRAPNGGRGGCVGAGADAQPHPHCKFVGCIRINMYICVCVCVSEQMSNPILTVCAFDVRVADVMGSNGVGQTAPTVKRVRRNQAK